ncbi:hypothetical protein HOD75_03605 [archaeon]|jgi:hypothetical protein|nr:hypothetical protein [archaeon]MBT4241957.1 hypothetical protein [archaeon]MBT4418504.1 hypothetical protein [archaeon]
MEKEEFKKELQKSFAIRLMYYLAIIFLIFVFFLIALTPLINKPEFISLKISLFISFIVAIVLYIPVTLIIIRNPSLLFWKFLIRGDKNKLKRGIFSSSILFVASLIIFIIYFDKFSENKFFLFALPIVLIFFLFVILSYILRLKESK